METLLLLIACVPLLVLGQSSYDHCPHGKEKKFCFFDPCRTANCPAHPTATCKANYCGGCYAEFTVDGKKVDCDCPKDRPRRYCYRNPCYYAPVCKAYPKATCLPDYCGGCSPAYFFEGKRVTCEVCVVGEKTFKPGDMYDAEDGCNTCTCNSDGTITCTEDECAKECTFGGETFDLNVKFTDPDPDVCNECICTSPKRVVCYIKECPKVVCEKGDKTYEAGDTFKEGCKDCTCGDDGKITCTDKKCPPGCPDKAGYYKDKCEHLCDNVICPGGKQCVPNYCTKPCGFLCVPKVCKYNGMDFPVGEDFNDTVTCNKCFCKYSGVAQCTDEHCPTGCLCDDKIYTVGETFKAEDDCSTCVCNDKGLIDCKLKKCGCEYKGKLFKYGAEFYEGCRHCECLTTGELKCEEKYCKPGCEMNGVSYSLGQEFYHGCQHCKCHLYGGVTCDHSKCSTNVKDKEIVCKFGYKAYKTGDKFKIGCRDCKCNEQGRIVCKKCEEGKEPAVTEKPPMVHEGCPERAYYHKCENPCDSSYCGYGRICVPDYCGKDCKVICKPDKDVCPDGSKPSDCSKAQGCLYSYCPWKCMYDPCDGCRPLCVTYTGKDAPKDGSYIPQNGNHAPTYGDYVPQNGNPAPKYGNYIPQNGNQAPKYGDYVPQNGNHAPKYGNKIPQNGN